MISLPNKVDMYINAGAQIFSGLPARMINGFLSPQSRIDFHKINAVLQNLEKGNREQKINDDHNIDYGLYGHNENQNMDDFDTMAHL